VLKLANIKSQIKRNKTNEKARQRNKAVRTEVRSYIRVVRENIAAGKKDEAQQAYAVAARKLDKAVSKGVLHKNNAANRKSRRATRICALWADDLGYRRTGPDPHASGPACTRPRHRWVIGCSPAQRTRPSRLTSETNHSLA